MREIKFRGLFDGEWKYGSYHKVGTHSFILREELDSFNTMGTSNYLIKENTQGQYIGIQDNNGNDVYEGDNVIITYGDTEVEGVIQYSGTGFKVSTLADDWDIDMYNSLQAIGNIHTIQK